MNDDIPILYPAEGKYLLESVVDLQEAVQWIAHGNFAGFSLGPRILLQFAKDNESLDRVFFETHGREQLALDLLLHHAEVGEVRMFGRKATLVGNESFPNEDTHWGGAADTPEPIPSEFISSASWSEDDGGSIDDGSIRYVDLTVHHGDLLKSFPARGSSAFDKGADPIRNQFAEAMGDKPKSSNSLASVETKCRQWIAQLAAQGVIPRSRDDLFSRALTDFPNGLSRRAFDRCWDNAAPENWKRAGRKPRQD
jgi:hypothetical protein